MSRTGVHAQKIFLIVTTCPTCGSVSTKWNGVTVGTPKSLHATSALHKQVIEIYDPTSLTAGTLQVLVASNAPAAVIIEGLTVCQS